MRVQIDTSNFIANGKTTVTTAGSRVILGNQQCKSVTIKALSSNTGTMYVGDGNVTSVNGFPLAAGDTLSLDLTSINVIYINASVSGEAVAWIAIW